MMSLKGNLNENRIQAAGLDTNLFIYYFEGHPLFEPIVRELFRSFSLQQTTLSTSVLTVTELMSLNKPEKALQKLEIALETMPYLKIIDVNREIARYAAKIRRMYGFRFVDSIQLATAVETKADVFITNDQRLKHCEELPIYLLSSM